MTSQYFSHMTCENSYMICEFSHQTYKKIQLVIVEQCVPLSSMFPFDFRSLSTRTD